MRITRLKERDCTTVEVQGGKDHCGGHQGFGDATKRSDETLEALEPSGLFRPAAKGHVFLERQEFLGGSLILKWDVKVKEVRKKMLTPEQSGHLRPLEVT